MSAATSQKVSAKKAKFESHELIRKTNSGLHQALKNGTNNVPLIKATLFKLHLLNGAVSSAFIYAQSTEDKRDA